MDAEEEAMGVGLLVLFVRASLPKRTKGAFLSRQLEIWHGFGKRRVAKAPRLGCVLSRHCFQEHVLGSLVLWFCLTLVGGGGEQHLGLAKQGISRIGVTRHCDNPKDVLLWVYIPRFETPGIRLSPQGVAGPIIHPLSGCSADSCLATWVITHWYQAELNLSGLKVGYHLVYPQFNGKDHPRNRLLGHASAE